MTRLTLDNDVIIQIDGLLRLRYVHGEEKSGKSQLHKNKVCNSKQTSLEARIFVKHFLFLPVLKPPATVTL